MWAEWSGMLMATRPRAWAFPPHRMPIITWMGALVTAYLADLDAWWDRGIAETVCVSCQTPCRRHSCRSRAAWTQFETRQAERIPVLRLYCPTCGTTVTLLPDFLAPRQRYQTPVREALVTGADPAPPCERQTRARWIRTARATLPRVLGQLTHALLTTVRPLGRQEPACLTGAFRGLEGLRGLRALLTRAGWAAEASGLFGWANREVGALAGFL